MKAVGINKDSKLNKYILFVYMIGWPILLAVRDIGGVNINKFIYFAFIAVAFAIADYETDICLLCFTLPLLNGLPDKYVLLVIIVCLLAKCGKIEKTTIGFASFFIVMEFAASLFYPSVDLIEIAGYCFGILLFFFLLYQKLPENYLSYLKFYYIGVCVFFVIIVISNLMSAPDYWLELFVKGWYRIGNENTTSGSVMKLGVNADEIGSYSVFGFFAGMVLQKEYGKKHLIIRIASLVFILIAGMLSVTRTFVVVIALFVLVYVLASMKNTKKMGIALAFIGLVAAILAVIIAKNPELLEAFVYRFTAEDMSGGNGRIEAIVIHLKAWLTNFRGILMGVGVTKNVEVLGTYDSVHNMLVQMLECYGVFGFFVYLIGMLKPALDELKKKPDIEYILLFLSILLYGQLVPCISPFTIMLHYTMGVFALKCKNNKDSEMMVVKPIGEVNYVG